MKIKKFFLVLISMVIFLASCQQTSVPTDAVKTVPTPASDKATVTGKVVSLTGSKPYANTVVYLAEIHSNAGESAFVLDTAHSPAAKTDAAGNFVFINVAPADYAFIVCDPMGSYGIVPDEKDSNKARVWTVAANKVLDIGTLSVDLK